MVTFELGSGIFADDVKIMFFSEVTVCVDGVCTSTLHCPAWLISVDMMLGPDVSRLLLYVSIVTSRRF
jgi:hypothetical protein